MSTAIIIGDIHIKTDNIEQINLFRSKIIQVIQNKKPDFIVMLGDILDTHERIHTTCLNKAYEIINDIRKFAPTYILVGNHDMINNQQFLTTEHWMNGMKEWKNVIVVDKVVKENNFIFCPYVYPGRFEEALSSLEEDWKSASAIFCHQEFYGSKFGAITSVDGDKWELNYPNIISGHIHKSQKPQSNIYYTGSSIQVAFGETDKPIIPFATFKEDGTYDIEEIDLQLPVKKIVYMDIDDIESYDVPTNTEDKIKITLNGDYNEFKTLKKTKKFKEIIDKGIKVVFKAKKNEVKLKNEKLQEILDEGADNDFTNIIKKIIDGEDNKQYLNELYDIVINNKNINLDDIFFF